MRMKKQLMMTARRTEPVLANSAPSPVFKGNGNGENDILKDKKFLRLQNISIVIENNIPSNFSSPGAYYVY